MILVAYAWLAVATPQPKCLVRERIDTMPARCIIWSKQ